MEKKYFKRRNNSGAIVEIVGTHESGDHLCLWVFSNPDGEPFRFNPWDFNNDFIAIDESEVKSVVRQRCGERGEGVSLPDYWIVRPNGDRTCSFCGSLHPDDVLAKVKEHGTSVIEATTKYYKWYIKQPNVSNALEGGIKYYRYHDTDEFLVELKLLLK